MNRITFLLVLVFSTLSCDQFIGNKKEDSYQLLQRVDGNTSIVDLKNKKILVMNQSNRITDVVDLELTSDQISFIKSQKDINDKKVKVNYWPYFHPTKEKYEVSLATRYYKDQCLYKISVEPSDTRLQLGYFKLIDLRLIDGSGFTLEEVLLPRSDWISIVDSTGKAISMQLVGKIPMTLDNYMEISDWTCTWNSGN